MIFHFSKRFKDKMRTFFQEKRPLDLSGGSPSERRNGRDSEPKIGGTTSLRISYPPCEAQHFRVKYEKKVAQIHGLKPTSSKNME
jgi:hypothetical protein